MSHEGSRSRSGEGIAIRGARQHNLRDVDVDLPRGKLVLITGPSGSGKSSLAFDTLFAEGQRRYVESLSAQARQFLHQLPKPDVDRVWGLSPAIALQQEAPPRNPRSTVGTVTEIHDFLRLLFARAGKAHCPGCGQPVTAKSVQDIVDTLWEWAERTRFRVLAPLGAAPRDAWPETFDRLRKEGFVRVVVDGETRDLGEEIAVDPQHAPQIDVVIDRLSVKPHARQRATEAVELALRVSDGVVAVDGPELQRHVYSEQPRCLHCGWTLPPLTAAMFSFNSPQGACPRCDGLGRCLRFDPARVVPDPRLALRDGAIAPWGKAGGAFHRRMLETLQRALDPDVARPWHKLSEHLREAILHGNAEYEGVIPMLERRLHEVARRKGQRQGTERALEYLQQEAQQYAADAICDTCDGTRLGPEARSVRVGEMDLPTLLQMPLEAAAEVLKGLRLEGRAAVLAEGVIADALERIAVLEDLGVAYLALARATDSLSGGELQRVRLAMQIGAELSGVLYVLDEPTVGLHPRDVGRLLRTLQALRDRGNSVVVVEHDEQLIRAADWVVDLGPGAGRLGGKVVAEGTPEAVQAEPASPTGRYLAGERTLKPRRTRGPRARRKARLRGASTHNLQRVDVDIPLQRLVCVTGVSGSGKSSLVMDTLLPLARHALQRATAPDSDATLAGIDSLQRVVYVDQSRIGRSARSTPVTYLGVFAPLRELFAGLPEARSRGYDARRFSFNAKGGRCEACEGQGVLRVEMQFLPDVHVRCERCEGTRYNRETLEVRYRGYSIGDVLAMTIDEAYESFSAVPAVRARFDAARAVGLGYLQLGQHARDLSGGEAQRLKLSRELGRRSEGATLYVLDEPTTGLHFGDVELLIGALDALVDEGHSVVVVEHDMHVAAQSDYIVDLGPGGGEAGGRVVASGAPADVACEARSHTAPFLRAALEGVEKSSAGG